MCVTFGKGLDKKLGGIILSMVLCQKNGFRMSKESFTDLCFELKPFVLKNLRIRVNGKFVSQTQSEDLQSTMVEMGSKLTHSN